MVCIALLPGKPAPCKGNISAPVFHDTEIDHILLISKKDQPIVKEKFAMLFFSKLRLMLTLYSAGYMQLIFYTNLLLV